MLALLIALADSDWVLFDRAIKPCGDGWPHDGQHHEQKSRQSSRSRLGQNREIESGLRLSCYLQRDPVRVVPSKIEANPLARSLRNAKKQRQRQR